MANKIKFMKFYVTDGTLKARVFYSLDNRSDKRPCVIEVTAEELAELRDRFEYLIETARENMEWESERAEWLGRLNAARAFLKQTARMK